MLYDYLNDDFMIFCLGQNYFVLYVLFCISTIRTEKKENSTDCVCPSESIQVNDLLSAVPLDNKKINPPLPFLYPILMHFSLFLFLSTFFLLFFSSAFSLHLSLSLSLLESGCSITLKPWEGEQMERFSFCPST